MIISTTDCSCILGTKTGLVKPAYSATPFTVLPQSAKNLCCLNQNMEFSGQIFGNNDYYRFSLSSEFLFNSSSRLRLFEPFLLDFSGFKETPACGVRVIGCANIEKCHPRHYLKQAPEKVPSGCLVWGMGICPLVGPTQAPPSCRCTSRLATSTLFAQCN